MSLSPEHVACRGHWVVMLQRGLEISTGCTGSGAPGMCRPGPDTTCVLTRATQHKLQYDLQNVPIYAGLKGAQERQSCKPRLAVTSVGPGAN